MKEDLLQVRFGDGQIVHISVGQAAGHSCQEPSEIFRSLW